MNKYDFGQLKPDKLVCVATLVHGYKDARSRSEVDALYELVGVDRATTLMLDPWVLVERRTAAGKPWRGGSYAWLRSTTDPDIELMIHRSDLRHYTAPEEAHEIEYRNRVQSERAAMRRKLHVVADPPAATSAAGPVADTTGPALAFKVERAPWLDNTRVAAVYVDLDPQGQVSCAVVVGKPGKAILTMRAATPEDLEALGPIITRNLVDSLRKAKATP